MAKPRVRLKEIAESTGYSVNTVSLALRGSPRLPEETRALILKEAERQNYLPNHIARSLKNQATHTIGLVLTDIMNPTITLAARTIEQQLANAGYGVMFAASDNVLANEVKALSRFQSYQVDGIIIYPTNRNETDHIAAIHDSGMPILALADVSKGKLNVVAVDDRMGAYKAVEHLISKGHKQIAILDGAYSLGHSDKVEGAQKALSDAGLPVENLRIINPLGSSAAHGFRAAQKALEQSPRPTALFATTDSLGIGVLNWCINNGVNVPG
ncbi:MAG: LacI family DNA-binding transcriptional regulator, partial [Rhizobiales bacterium]|nr:LacI family DNA-binding transcriptional regulator [Hyphomicrobiales bacterium]